jgi:uroporphyrin-III C-methyltransferase
VSSVTSRTDRDRDGRLSVFDGGARVPARPRFAKGGKVWLVGAGPGDPDLLTLKAARVLAAADVVVHDRLVPEAILALAAPAARMIHVGKRKSHHTVPQEGVNDLLTALAHQGFQVVRLKGGDPFVFGRGGEEMLACRAAGVEIEVVPGITAGMAASAAAGAPLTHRGLAQAVTFVTGHAAPPKTQDGDGEAWGEPDLDWAFLARPNHTVVVYMGLSTAPSIAARLTAAGRAGATPVLLVENVSRLDERRVLTTLAGLSDAVAGLDGPTILIIGEVAALSDSQGLADAQGVALAAQSNWKCA